MKATTIMIIALASASWGSSSATAAGGDGLLESIYAEMKSRNGQGYVEARERLLSEDQSAVRPFLLSKLQETNDPIEQLWLQAVEARLINRTRLTTALDEAFDVSSTDTSWIKRNPHGPRTPPQPDAGGWVLVRRLGDDAAPLATELLVKDITKDWESWKKEALVDALRRLGQTRTADGTKTAIRDPRAGLVLLTVVEHMSDEHVALLASNSLGTSFASEELLAAAEITRERVESVSRKNMMDRVVRRLKSELPTKEQLATRPASTVSTSLPFKFTPNPNRSLSRQEKTELDRIIAIASDSDELVERRLQAIGLLGERAAHCGCIEPLRRILVDDSEPEELHLAAVVALSQIPDRSVVPILVDALEECRNIRVRMRALSQLNKMSPGRAFSRYGTCTAEAYCDAAAEWWRSWWTENQEDFVPDRISVLLNP